MKKKFFYGLIIASLFLYSSAYATPQDDGLSKEIAQMNWQKGTTFSLPLSNSKISLPDGYAAVYGKDAQRLMEMGNSKSNPICESVVIAPNDRSEVYFEFIGDGYVKDDDWKDVNATDLLKGISENTEKSNAARAKDGIPSLHVIKWLQEPTLDNTSHTVFWAIQAESNSKYLVNSIALRLGRDGYEKVTSVTSLEDYTPLNSDLDVLLRAHSFALGKKYEDHASGDKVAGYGLAALVGAVAGAKLIKVAAASGLAIFFKQIIAVLMAMLAKAWVIILAPFIWVKQLFAKRFKKNAS